jgi:protein required for attachment to host cells
MPMTTWIVAADASRARVYAMERAGETPQPVEEFDNPAGRAHNRDLVTDGDGRYFGKGERTQGHTAPPGESAVEHEVELFAKRLAGYLDRARIDHKYERLRLVAAPKFLGLLRQNLSKEVDKLVDDAIAKDVSWFDENALAEYLKQKTV